MSNKTNGQIDTMDTTWILVANGSEAKLYNALNKDLFPTNLNHLSVHFIEEFSHPKSREKDSEMLTDGMGRYSSMGGPNSNFVNETDPHVFEIDKFSRELADMLDNRRKTNGIQNLILICPARFYGDLNKHLSDQVTKLIQTVIKKDYTKEPQQKLVEHLKDALALK